MKPYLDRSVYPRTLAKYAELHLMDLELAKVLERGSQHEIKAMSEAVTKARAELDTIYKCELSADPAAKKIAKLPA